jgi:hypothetical protein
MLQNYYYFISATKVCPEEKIALDLLRKLLGRNFSPSVETGNSIYFMKYYQCSATPVIAGPEPPKQTGKKVTFWSQTLKRMKKLRLWLPWVREGYIHPFPTLAHHFKDPQKRFGMLGPY